MITGVCKPERNGYKGQVDCVVHGTPWPCEVTEEFWEEAKARSKSNEKDS